MDYEWTEDRANMEYILYYQSAAADSAKRVLVDANGLHQDVSVHRRSENSIFILRRFSELCNRSLVSIERLRQPGTCLHRYGWSTMSTCLEGLVGTQSRRCSVRRHYCTPKLGARSQYATGKPSSIMPTCRILTSLKGSRSAWSS